MDETRKPRRPPPRLRTKTGCLKCRERRKKCDERRPTCSACARLQVACIFGDATSGENRQSSETSSPVPAVELVSRSPENWIAHSPLPTSMVIKHGGLSTQRDCNVFQYCATKYIQLLTTPEATSEFRDLSFVFGLGFDEPWVMHAALAPAALHASYSELVPKEAAISYSQSALHGLRRAIQTRFRDNTISRDMVLAASLYLGVFEVCLSPSWEAA